MPLYAWIAYASVLLSALAVCLAAVRLFKGHSLRSLQSRVGGLESELSEMAALLARIDARDRMRKVRSAKTEPEESSLTTNRSKNAKPDPISQPAEWKAYMRAQHPAIGPHNPPKESE